MYNFDPYNVLLAISTNKPVLLMTAFVLQGHICNITVLLFLKYDKSVLACGKMYFSVIFVETCMSNTHL